MVLASVLAIMSLVVFADLKGFGIMRGFSVMNYRAALSRVLVNDDAGVASSLVPVYGVDLPTGPVCVAVSDDFTGVMPGCVSWDAFRGFDGVSVVWCF